MNTFLKHTASLSGLASMLFLSGCLVGPKYKAPVVSPPPAFSGQPATAADEAALAEWWTSFGDETLNALERDAIHRNLDVEVAIGRLREARANLRYTADSNQLPSVDLKAEYSRNGTSLNNPQIPKLGGQSSSNTLIPRQYGVYQAYFDASYEIDIFGAVRHTVSATAAEAQGYEDSVRDTLVSVTAEVARDYFLLRQYQNEIEVANENLAAQQDTLQITRVRYKAGLATDLDTARAAANVASTKATIPTLESNEAKTLHAISVLLGQNPDAVTAQLHQPAELATAPDLLSVGLPSELLRRRPDIRKAERDLAAANQRVGAQVAGLFPSISLSAQYGGQSGAVGSLANAASRYFSYGPTIDFGILNYASKKQNIRIYKARQEQQYSTYKKTVIKAFADVDDSLVAYDAEKKRFAALDVQVKESKRSYGLANEKYTKGLSTFLDVLDAQRTLLSAENSLIESKANVSMDLIALYKAVGGGWGKNDLSLSIRR